MWLRTLLHIVNCSHSRPTIPRARRGAPRRQSAPCRLAVETLEDRIVPASLSVADAAVIEGTTEAQYAVVSVNLDAPTGKTVSVKYATAKGTAVAGADYVASSGRLTFAPGETSKTIQIPVIGDSLHEPDETFLVNLSRARGAMIADGQGVVTIVDDESRVRVGIYDAMNTGEPMFTFTVVLSAAYDEAVTVNYATVDGSALAGVHYVADSGTLTFAPGETTKTITVDAIDMAAWDRYFYVQLSDPSANALLSDDQGLGFWFDSGYPGYGYDPYSGYYW